MSRNIPVQCPLCGGPYFEHYEVLVYQFDNTPGSENLSRPRDHYRCTRCTVVVDCPEAFAQHIAAYRADTK